MTIESIIAFIAAMLVWVLIPGPAILAIIGRSLTKGLNSALVLIGGILIGDVFYISIALFGMAAIGKVLGEMFFVIRLLGASYLIYIGLKLWFKESKLKKSVQIAERSGHLKCFLAGISITLGNPKAILFHLGFLPTFFDLSTIGFIDVLLIITIFMIVLGSSLTIYAYLASKSRIFFNNEKKLRILNRCAGTVMISAGIAVATKK